MIQVFLTHLANRGDDSAIHKNTAALYITSNTALRNISFNTSDREEEMEMRLGDIKERKKIRGKREGWEERDNVTHVSYGGDTHSHIEGSSNGSIEVK